MTAWYNTKVSERHNIWVQVPPYYDGQELYFSEVKVDRIEQDLIIPGGLETAIDMAYATPIGPKLLELALERQNKFKNHLANSVAVISNYCNQ